METRKRQSARVGYATNDDGAGIVYARIVENGRARILRAAFRLSKSDNGGDPRAAGFAALCAIAPLLRRHAADVDVLVDDVHVAENLTHHSELPAGLLLAYVGARCALNTLRSARLLVAAGPNDLAARARAEVSLRIAA